MRGDRREGGVEETGRQEPGARSQELAQTSNLKPQTFPSPQSLVPGSSATPHPLPFIPDLIEIGKIVAPQGLKGELRVYPDSDFPERFVQPGMRWLLKPGHKEPQPVELVRGKHQDGKGLYVIQLAGVVDRTQAEALKGAKLLVPASDRPPLAEDEFHVSDLIGLNVFDQITHAFIGVVVNVISAGNDLLEVERCAQTETFAKKPATVLIPFVKAIVPVVDLDQKRIEITPPKGLIG
ncbi:ribosome maturation factor RimM [Leptothermofonsia sp. ETS-13]|uniref:ribosome maturation factor RimM n=1 Tax=Leptothermofonsia sp. ETS-13 TaxID=3035696 RepID=UPI003B9F3FC8